MKLEKVKHEITKYTIELTDDELLAIQIMVGEFTKEGYRNVCGRFATLALYDRNTKLFHDIFNDIERIRGVR